MNFKALAQAGSYIALIIFAFSLILTPSGPDRAAAAPEDQDIDYMGTAAQLVTQTHLATYTPGTSTPTLTPSATGTPGTPFLTFPFVTHLGDFYLGEHTFFFSYYFPDLGGVNCHEDNWENGRCKDTTASGMPWRSNLSKAVAIHPDFLELLPYGSVIRIVDPLPLIGEYMVIDLCGGCNINGYYYFDFLFQEMPVGVTWSDPVKFQVMRVGFLNLPPTATFTPMYEYLPTWTPTPTLPISTETSSPTDQPSSTPTMIIELTATQTPTATNTLEAVP